MNKWISPKTRLLICLIIIFSLPGVVAYYVYEHPAYLSGRASSNHGTFVQPLFQAMPKSGAAHWRLVLWHPDICESACMETLNRLARVRLALGRHLYGLDLCLLSTSQAMPLKQSDVVLLHEHDIQTQALSSQDAMRIVSRYPSAVIWLVNPNGQAVLMYSLQTASDDIFRDVKQLVG